MPHIDPDTTIRDLLEHRAREAGSHIYCRFGDRAMTIGELDEAVNRFANGLIAAGIGPGDRVGVMLPQHPDHIVAFLALAKLGALQVPINVHQIGAPLQFLIEHSEPDAVIADGAYRDQILSVLDHFAVPITVWRGGVPAGGFGKAVHFSELAASSHSAPPPLRPRADDTLVISYTSGTTGMPKGAMVSDKMLRAAALGCIMIGDLGAGDVLHCWEPFYHMGGTEVLVAAVMQPITLAIVDRFSASQFWNQVRHYNVTRMHYIGAVLQLLLKQPPSSDDRNHYVRIAWGGGCPVQVWREFEERFGLELREGYGMTETSSFTCINKERRVGSVGRQMPWFEMRIVDDGGRPLGPDEVGEIIVREVERGLVVPGYFKNPEATTAALRDGWYYTGDLGRCDTDGHFYFAGRKKDSVRRRGENISAWEVERMINQHPDVEESALVSVTNELADEDLKIFIQPVAGRSPEPLEIIKWCEGRMPYFQIPRFVALVNEFPRTPTQRIRKQELSRALDDCWDLEKSGYRLARGPAAQRT